MKNWKYDPIVVILSSPVILIMIFMLGVVIASNAWSVVFIGVIIGLFIYTGIWLKRKGHKGNDD